MVLYFVSWIPDPKLCKGKGRLSGDELYIMFSVLCDSISTAQRCFLYHFNYEFKTTHGLTVDDGELKLKRAVIDSRSFHPRYLMLKAMDMPISLIDPVSSLIRYSKKYSSPRL